MRAAIIALALWGAVLHAEGPAGSFHAFIAAVLDTSSPEAERRALFEKYFDFDAWVAERQAAEGKRYTAAEKSQMKEEWMTVFLSDEFRQRFAARNVQVVEEPEPAGDDAELVIRIMTPASAAGRYRVKLKRSGDHWRWYSIPRIEETSEPQTPDQRLAALKQALAEARAEQERIAQRIRDLEAQAKRVEAELAEQGANTNPHSSPMTTARNLGKAVQAADLEALLAAHMPARRKADRAKLREKLDEQSRRLASWEALDVTLSENKQSATVRVKLKLWHDTGVKERTLTIAMRLINGNWLVDEEP
ncbi:MAG: hypothetical protein KF696_02275 [Planctomycetes bacterium]|nr:hypothetical protein [Planctomycetota bacterium]MCW8134828.1 hypothetical protein [Planctomycetota bacterium]